MSKFMDRIVTESWENQQRKRREKKKTTQRGVLNDFAYDIRIIILEKLIAMLESGRLSVHPEVPLSPET